MIAGAQCFAALSALVTSTGSKFLTCTDSFMHSNGAQDNPLLHLGVTPLSELLQQCMSLCADMRQAWCSISQRRIGASQPGTIALPWLCFLQVKHLTVFAVRHLASIPLHDFADCKHDNVKLQTPASAHSCCKLLSLQTWYHAIICVNQSV